MVWPSRGRARGRWSVALAAVAFVAGVAACSSSSADPGGSTASGSLSAVAASSQVAATASVSPPPTGAALTAALDQVVKAVYDFTGTVMVTRGDKILFAKAYGDADVKARKPVALTTRFQIGSVTKQFTAMAILMLEHAGKLRLSDKICSYIPNCPVTWKPITLTELLTHTSGLPDYFNIPAIESIVYRPQTPEQSLGIVRKLPLQFVPGTTYQYSNTGYLMLGMVIEKVSGMSYETFLQKHIFGPLGMRDTGYDHRHQGVAVGYAIGSKPNVPLIDMSVPFSAGALYSTVGDLHRWEMALVSGTVIPKALVAEMELPRVGTDTAYYGYGVRVNQTGTANPPQITLIYHSGQIPGFQSSVSHDPVTGLDVIILCNHDDADLNGMDDTLRQIVLGS